MPELPWWPAWPVCLQSCAGGQYKCRADQNMLHEIVSLEVFMARFAVAGQLRGKNIPAPPVASGHIFPSRPKTGVSREKPSTIFAHLANPIDVKPDRISNPVLAHKRQYRNIGKARLTPPIQPFSRCGSSSARTSRAAVRWVLLRHRHNGWHICTCPDDA